MVACIRLQVAPRYGSYGSRQKSCANDAERVEQRISSAPSERLPFLSSLPSYCRLEWSGEATHKTLRNDILQSIMLLYFSRKKRRKRLSVFSTKSYIAIVLGMGGVCLFPIFCPLLSCDLAPTSITTGTFMALLGSLSSALFFWGPLSKHTFTLRTSENALSRHAMKKTGLSFCQQQEDPEGRTRNIIV